ncbi:MAG: sulfotransferase [Leptolyngbya sp. SIOISBB]|nr:sulfotransferase [Leptolyngbya sp. SIOISBB]
MDTLFSTVDLIPPSNFVEVRYEDLEHSEITCLKYIYEQLSLPGFEKIQNKFQDYIVEQAGYQKNQYSLDEATKERVYLQWQNAVDRWMALPKIDQTVV